MIADPAYLNEHFQDVSARLGTTFTPSEATVRLLAQASLTIDTAAAIAFGEIRAELYPDSHRAREFLGDVWAGKGETEKARAAYQQALDRGGDAAALREKLGGLGG